MNSQAEFDRLVIPLSESLYGAAMRLTRDPSDAEDLVQDTMVRSFRFWDTFQVGTNVKSWLLTILRNTFINGYHRRARERSFAASVDGLSQSMGEAVAVGRHGDYGQPMNGDDLIDRSITVEAIHAALEQLQPDYRLAVSLCDLEGWSYREIADALEIPIGTVMSRIHRGRKALHGLLYGYACEAGLVDESDDGTVASVFAA
jgi:RNA polymerase sigma-70 factor (ECF subfamily)